MTFFPQSHGPLGPDFGPPHWCGCGAGVQIIAADEGDHAAGGVANAAD